MKAPIEKRWIDEQGARGTVESRAARLLRAAVQPRPLSSETLHEIEQRLSRAIPPTSRSALLQRAAVVCVVTLSLVVVGSTVARILDHRTAITTRPAPSLSVPIVRQPIVRRASLDADRQRDDGAQATQPAAPAMGAAVPLVNPPTNGPAARESAQSSSRARRSTMHAEADAPAAAQGTLGAQADVIQQGLRLLRERKDPGAAIDLLSRFEGLFPGGILAAEAESALVEALMAGGRESEALNMLEAPGHVLPAGPRRWHAIVLRGELRARTGRCAEAVQDFDELLMQSSPDGSAAERALFGRANCRLANGDSAAARADFTAYLALYPRGRFAEAAGRALVP